jgi:hypothetical protein
VAYYIIHAKQSIGPSKDADNYYLVSHRYESKIAYREFREK